MARKQTSKTGINAARSSLQDVVGCRRLAEEVAAYLFMNGAGQEASRLVLELGNGREGGGWCRAAVIDGVEHILKAANGGDDRFSPAQPSANTH